MAIIANIFIDQGTDFSITVDVTDSTGDALNMSGYSASAQIRKTYSSSTASARRRISARTTVTTRTESKQTGPARLSTLSPRLPLWWRPLLLWGRRTSKSGETPVPIPILPGKVGVGFAITLSASGLSG